MAIYPFSGVLRWAALPAFLATAGALDGLIGWALQQEEGVHFLPIWIVPQVNHALAIGLALAGGRHPGAALALAFALGFPTPWMDGEILSALPLGIYGVVTPWTAGVARAIGATLMVLTHHLYLRARRKGGPWIAAVLLMYAGIGFLSALLVDWGFRGSLRFGENLRWGTQSAVLSWMFLAVAVRLAELKGRERAAPLPDA